jgi:aspartate racemase
MSAHHITAPRIIGIIGGMGPAATVDLMQKIVAATPVERDQDHIPLIVWNVPQIPPRVPAIASADAPSPIPALRHAARALANAGAQAIAIACNTAHHWSHEIENASGLPLLHIADAALDAVARIEPTPARVMLLATEGTLQSGFYSQRASARELSFALPNADLQSAINAAITAVKLNTLSEARAMLLPQLSQLRTAGIDRFLLACTELPMVVANSPVAQDCIDATDALAHAIVSYARSPSQIP